MPLKESGENGRPSKCHLVVMCRLITDLWCFHTRVRQRQDNKTNVESVHSYDAFHTRLVGPGVKGIIGMHRFKICLVVVLLWCENTITVTLNCSGNFSLYFYFADRQMPLKLPHFNPTAERVVIKGNTKKQW